MKVNKNPKSICTLLLLPSVLCCGLASAASGGNPISELRALKLINESIKESVQQYQLHHSTGHLQSRKVSQQPLVVKIMGAFIFLRPVSC